MAKQQQQQQQQPRKQLDFEDEDGPVVPASEVPPLAPVPGLVELPQQEAPPRWRVTLVCPTPLAHKTLEVEGANEEEARKAFCAANGISGSVHVWTVERLLR